MKRLNLLFLAVGLFVQGCSEVPLFKDGDELQSNEAVVIFNMYTTDYKMQGNVYMNFKLNGQMLQIFSESNHLVGKDISQKYIAAIVPAGKYYLMQFDTYYVCFDGAYIYRTTLTSPVYNANLAPLVFSVAQGEVKYLGDIKIGQASLTFDSKYIPLFIIYNRFADAKKFMEQKYSSIAGRLTEGLIQKSAAQVMIEEECASDFKQK